MFGPKQIQGVIPHRYPFLLVDQIVEHEYRKRVVGQKNVTINEPFFQGHFPDDPVMPGVFIVEAMAQTGGFLFAGAEIAGAHERRYIAALDRVKFLKPVLPGDVLYLELELLQEAGGLAKAAGVARVNDQIVAKAEITYAVRA